MARVMIFFQIVSAVLLLLYISVTAIKSNNAPILILAIPGVLMLSWLFFALWRLRYKWEVSRTYLKNSFLTRCRLKSSRSRSDDEIVPIGTLRRSDEELLDFNHNPLACLPAGRDTANFIHNVVSRRKGS